jgi:hypothetical protein
VAACLKGIPQTKKGNPIPGKFEYKSYFNSCTKEQLYTIPIDAKWECDTVLYIAAQAVVRRGCQSESAWGKGYDFPGKNWAMYFTYGVQCPEPACTGSIGGHAWQDLPVNGVFNFLLDPNEPLIPDLTVTLRDTADEQAEPIQTTVTDENGEYLFPGLCEGTYYVQISPADPYLFLEQCVINEDEPNTPNDNNCSPSQVTLETDSSSDLTIDFGFTVPF